MTLCVIAEMRCCVLLKVGTPVELVMVVEGLELQALLELKGSSVNGVEMAWEESGIEVCEVLWTVRDCCHVCVEMWMVQWMCVRHQSLMVKAREGKVGCRLGGKWACRLGGKWGCRLGGRAWFCLMWCMLVHRAVKATMLRFAVEFE